MYKSGQFAASNIIAGKFFHITHLIAWKDEDSDDFPTSHSLIREEYIMWNIFRA